MVSGGGIQEILNRIGERGVLIPASFCTVGGLVRLRGGTEFRFRGGDEEGGARFSISAAGGEGGCQLGWRAHAGLKPASRRCEREIFLRSLALALNFRCSPRSHRLPSTTMVVSTSRYCRRASEDVLSTHSFSKFLDKMAYLAKFGNTLARGRGGGSILEFGGGPRHPSPIVICRGGGADPPSRL